MSQPNVRTITRNILLDNGFACAFINLCGSAILIGYFKHIRAGDVGLGLAIAIPSLMGLMQIPGAVVGRRSNGYKKFVATFGVIWRLLHILVLTVACLPSLGGSRLPIMLMIVGIASALVQFSDPIYQDWIAEIIPETSRGAFYAKRASFCGAASALAGLLGGAIVDYFNYVKLPDRGFQVSFALGLVCAAISFFFYLKVPDKVRAKPERENLRHAVVTIQRPYRDTNFRKVLVFLFAFVFGQMFMGGLLVAYCLEVLKMPFTVMQSLGLLQAATAVIVAPWWGQMCDRFGNKAVLAVLCVGIALSPLGWFFSRPEQLLFNTILLAPCHIFSGISWAGVGIAQFNLILATSTTEHRANYLASGQSLMAVTAALSPFLGSVLMENLRGMTTAAHAYLTVLAVCMGLRLVSAVFLRNVHEHGATPIRAAVREMSLAAPIPFIRRVDANDD